MGTPEFREQQQPVDPWEAMRDELTGVDTRWQPRIAKMLNEVQSMSSEQASALPRYSYIDILMIQYEPGENGSEQAFESWRTRALQLRLDELQGSSVRL